MNEIAINKHTPVAPKKRNLTKTQCKCIDKLARDTSIVIKQADKGGAFVVWDCVDYITEGLRQLHDLMFYTKQACDMTVANTTQVNHLVDRLLETQEIDGHIHQMLLTEDPHTPNFICPPKFTRTNHPARVDLLFLGMGDLLRKFQASLI